MTQSAWLVAALLTTAFLAGCIAPAGAPGVSAGTPSAAEVHIRNTKFDPPVLQVAIGATVTWTNDDPYQHTVTAVDAVQWGTAGSGDDSAKWLAPSATWAHTFATAGTYAYRCIPHSWQAANGTWSGQVGKIVVAESAQQADDRLAASVPAKSVAPSPIAPARSLPGADGIVRLSLETVEVTARISDGVGYRFWTFNETVPGPMLRVREGDTVELTLKNRADSTMAHSIDLHAVTGPGGGAKATQTLPGGATSFTFKALNPGLYVYHCATPHIPTHIANGMYGLILVEPAGGLPPVDREFYVVQGEFYAAGALGAKGVRDMSTEKMLDERPTYVLLNGGIGAIAGEGALKANVNETVRIYFGVGGFLASSFHVIGEIFDAVYPEGGFPPVSHVQTTFVPAGGAAMVDFKVEVPGAYVLVDHSLTRAIDRGAAGVLVVEGPQDHAVFHGAETAGSGH